MEGEFGSPDWNSLKSRWRPKIFARSNSRSKLSQIKTNQKPHLQNLSIIKSYIAQQRILICTRKSETGCSEEGTEGKNKSQTPYQQDLRADQRGDRREERLRDKVSISSSEEQEIAVTLTKMGNWKRGPIGWRGRKECLSGFVVWEAEQLRGNGVGASGSGSWGQKCGSGNQQPRESQTRVGLGILWLLPGTVFNFSSSASQQALVTSAKPLPRVYSTRITEHRAKETPKSDMQVPVVHELGHLGRKGCH